MWSMMVGILAAFDITPTEDNPPDETFVGNGVVRRSVTQNDKLTDS